MTCASRIDHPAAMSRESSSRRSSPSSRTDELAGTAAARKLQHEGLADELVNEEGSPRHQQEHAPASSSHVLRAYSRAMTPSRTIVRDGHGGTATPEPRRSGGFHRRGHCKEPATLPSAIGPGAASCRADEQRGPRGHTGRPGRATSRSSALGPSDQTRCDHPALRRAMAWGERTAGARLSRGGQRGRAEPTPGAGPSCGKLKGPWWHRGCTQGDVRTTPNQVQENRR